jgi:hypothetical protein
MSNCLIVWDCGDGSEHEERWDSIDAFVSWAVGSGLHGWYRAFEADEDGDWQLVDQGGF